MFDLERHVAEWRQQIIAAGVASAESVDELESHLRDEMERQIAAGMNESAAFDRAVSQIGQPRELRLEFAKVASLSDGLKRFLHILAGVPEYQLAMNTNLYNTTVEPAWATYLKTAAYVVPGIGVWLGFLIFVVPKLKEICAAAGVTFWRPVVVALDFSDFLRLNLILLMAATLAALALLEWRSPRWRHYRRFVFGLLAYVLNVTTLLLIAALAICAVLAGASLLHPK